METLSIGNIGEQASVITGDKIVFARVDYDDSPANPLEEWDGMGTIHSLNRRHINYNPDAPDLLFVRECPECGSSSGGIAAIKGFATWVCDDCPEGNRLHVAQCSDAVALSYFEHGLCKWAVAGHIDAHNTPDWRWDGVDFAGVWVPDDDTVKEADEQFSAEQAAERSAWMEERARGVCEVYTLWCNGEVYGYTISVHKLEHLWGEPLEEAGSYLGDPDPLLDDSCWGFYGDLNYLVGEVNPMLEEYGIKLTY